MNDLDPIRTLLPAEKEFAAWLAVQPYRRSLADQLGMYSRLTGTYQSTQSLRTLRFSPEFRAQVKAYKSQTATQITAAKKVAEGMYTEAMRIHHRALKRADKKQDYKAIPALTEPVWKRVIPLRDDAAPAAQVAIVITTERLAALSKPPIAVEVEEVPSVRPAEP